MAGTARRWVLPYALPAILLGIFNENFSTSFLSGAGKSPLWECPECHCVERWPKGKAPRCRGPEDDRHPVAFTVRLDDEGRKQTGDPKRFFR